MLKIENITHESKLYHCVLVTHENLRDVAEWVGTKVTELSPGRFQVPMPDSYMDAHVGEWVVQDDQGKFDSLENIDGKPTLEYFGFEESDE